VRTEYRKAIQYSLDSLVQWVQRYGDDNTVLVLLGDHQPVPTVTGGSTSRDVPVTIVARDPKVLDRVADWGWTDGLKPAANAPTWGMDKFRDRFMTAYGPQSGLTSDRRRNCQVRGDCQWSVLVLVARSASASRRRRGSHVDPARPPEQRAARH
jgi:hypothetical protein